jgi:hypothetical protein
MLLYIPQSISSHTVLKAVAPGIHTQQDTILHTADDRVISKHFWSTKSPHLIPPDFSLLDLQKVKVYASRPSTVDYLQENIRQETAAIPAYTLQSEISGSHSDEYEDGCLPGCCAVWSSRNLPTFQRCLLPSSGRSSPNPEDIHRHVTKRI